MGSHGVSLVCLFGPLVPRDLGLTKLLLSHSEQNCVEALAAAFHLTGFPDEADLLYVSPSSFSGHLSPPSSNIDELSQLITPFSFVRTVLFSCRMSKFSWGHSFWEVNELLIKRYLTCSTAKEVSAMQDVIIAEMETERDDRRREKGT
jgi:hypothetical protein